jgi:Domain of unknown function (DUF1931)
MPVMDVARFEKFFRVTGGLDVDKGDLKKYNDFLDRKMYDLVKSGEAHAMANGHDQMWPSDLPITPGLERDIREFEQLDEEMGIEPVFEKRVKEPLLEVGYSKETEAQLPRIAGGLSLALARSFKIIDPGLKNPTYLEWERAFRMFDLLI